MSHALGLPAAAVLLAAGAWSGYLIARRIAGEVGPSVRLAGALVVWQCLAAVMFILLATAAAFRLPWALALCLVVAGALHRWLDGAGALSAVRADLRAVAAGVREFWASWPRRVLLAVGAGVVGVRFVIGLAAPPIAWDALTYHAYKPARWVQDGGWFVDRAPDQWRYLQFFPHGGEIPWAWAMLATGDDALLPIAAVGFWLLVGVAGTFAARTLGASRVASIYAGLTIAFLPPVTAVSITAYVDNAVLATFLLGSVALVQALRRGLSGQLLIAMAAFGWLAACKLSGLPQLGTVVLLLCWAVFAVRDGQPRARRLGWLVAGVAITAIVTAPGYLVAWLENGSPFYPLSLTVAGHTVVAGNEQLRRLYVGTPEVLAGGTGSARALLTMMLRPDLQLTWENYQGFGPAPLLLLPPAVLGFWRRVKTRELRAPVLALVALASLPVLGIMSNDFAGQRATWGGAIARLITVFPAVCALLCAQVEARALPVLWSVVLVVDWAISVPGGVTPPLFRAALAVVPAVALLAVSAVLAVVAYRRRAAWPWLTAGAVLCLAVAGATLGEARRRHRHTVYAALSDRPPAYILHLIKREYAGAWPVWKALDDGAPHRIALAAGWDGIGHNVLRYPLLGARLQNRVTYVPISRDGAIVDYERADQVRGKADVDAWLARLRAADIDTVVALDPPPPEAAWIRARPAVFERIASGIPGTQHAAFRFHPDRLSPED